MAHVDNARDPFWAPRVIHWALATFEDMDEDDIADILREFLDHLYSDELHRLNLIRISEEEFQNLSHGDQLAGALLMYSASYFYSYFFPKNMHKYFSPRNLNPTKMFEKMTTPSRNAFFRYMYLMKALLHTADNDGVYMLLTTSLQIWGFKPTMTIAYMLAHLHDSPQPEWQQYAPHKAIDDRLGKFAKRYEDNYRPVITFVELAYTKKEKNIVPMPAAETSKFARQVRPTAPQWASRRRGGPKLPKTGKKETFMPVPAKDTKVGGEKTQDDLKLPKPGISGKVEDEKVTKTKEKKKFWTRLTNSLHIFRISHTTSYKLIN